MSKHRAEKTAEATDAERVRIAKRIMDNHEKLRKLLFDAEHVARSIETDIKLDGTADMNGGPIKAIRGGLRLVSGAQALDRDAWRGYHHARDRQGF